MIPVKDTLRELEEALQEHMNERDQSTAFTLLHILSKFQDIVKLNYQATLTYATEKIGYKRSTLVQLLFHASKPGEHQIAGSFNVADSEFTTSRCGLLSLVLPRLRDILASYLEMSNFEQKHRQEGDPRFRYYSEGQFARSWSNGWANDGAGSQTNNNQPTKKKPVKKKSTRPKTYKLKKGTLNVFVACECGNVSVCTDHAKDRCSCSENSHAIEATEPSKEPSSLRPLLSSISEMYNQRRVEYESLFMSQQLCVWPQMDVKFLEDEDRYTHQRAHT